MTESKWSAWHYVTVPDLDDADPCYEILHPSGCAFRFECRPEHTSYEFSHACAVEHEVDGAGLEHIMNGYPPGFYALRVRHYKTRIGYLSEWDAEYDVRALTAPVEDAGGGQ